MSRRVNQEKLMAKIAAALNADVDELKAAAEETKDLYSHDERVLQGQSVINFYRTRIAPVPPTKKPGESSVAFNKREAEYEAAYNEWRFRECETCHLDFAYAYHYDGVKFCSLECLDAALRKIGLQVTVGKDLKRRWGIHHPAVVPASALATLREVYSSSSELHDALGLSDPHKSAPTQLPSD